MKLKCPKGDCKTFYKKNGIFYCFYHKIKAKIIKKNLEELITDGKQ